MQWWRLPIFSTMATSTILILLWFYGPYITDTLIDASPHNIVPLSNIGNENALGDYILFLPPNTALLEADWAKPAKTSIQLSDLGDVVRVGVLGDGNVVHGCGVVFHGKTSCDWGTTLVESYPFQGIDVSTLKSGTSVDASGDVVLLKRNLFEQIGLDHSLSLSDGLIDMCLRAKYDYNVSVVVDTKLRVNMRSNCHVSPVVMERWGTKLRNSVQIKTHILFSSLLGPKFSDSGFFQEAVGLITPLLRHSFLAIDENCHGWAKHNDECFDSWLGDPNDEIVQLIRAHSIVDCLATVPRGPLILIRHLPMDWFSEERTSSFFNDDTTRIPHNMLVSNGKRYLMDKSGKLNRVYRIARSVYESDSIPANWADKLNGYDEIWTPSVHNRNIFVDSGVDPLRIHVIPEAMDVHPTSRLKLDVKGFVLLSVLKWEDRKGWDVLIKAYMEEFSASDDISLVIRATYLDDLDPIGDAIAFLEQELHESYHDPPHVVILQNRLSSRDMDALYNTATVFALTSRGEGWGLPYHSAMALGKPCIATAWGGNMEFMNDMNAFLVWDYELKPATQLYGKWAEPNVMSVRKTLRLVYSNPGMVKAKGDMARRDMADFTTEAVSRRVIDRLGAIDLLLSNEQ